MLVIRGGVHWIALRTSVDMFQVNSEVVWYPSDIPNPEDHLLISTMREPYGAGGSQWISGAKERSTSTGLIRVHTRMSQFATSRR